MRGRKTNAPVETMSAAPYQAKGFIGRVIGGGNECVARRDAKRWRELRAVALVAHAMNDILGTS